jgi:sec-independent protein translocase protein TatB
MFEIGWTEILVVVLVAIVVLKPKDIPEMARSAGAFIAKMRGMAGEFQGQFNDALKDAKLDDVKKVIDEVRELKNLSPVQQAREALVKLADEANAVKSELQNVASTTSASITAATTAVTSGFNNPGSEARPAQTAELPGNLGIAPPEPAPLLNLDPLAAPPAPILVADAPPVALPVPSPVLAAAPVEVAEAEPEPAQKPRRKPKTTDAA